MAAGVTRFQQRVVVYREPGGESQIFDTVYGDETETQAALSRCKRHHPDADDLRVLDTNAAWPKSRLDHP